MKHRRPFLRFWAFATAIALAFSQAAMAAYTCPMSAGEMARPMAADDGCPDGNPGTKSLCLKFCQDEPQKTQPPTLDALPSSIEQGLRIERASPQVPSGHLGFGALLVRATSPPATILFARFLN